MALVSKPYLWSVVCSLSCAVTLTLLVERVGWLDLRLVVEQLVVLMVSRVRLSFFLKLALFCFLGVVVAPVCVIQAQVVMLHTWHNLLSQD